MKRTPIKRNEFLKPISREHHFGLLLCWKIRTGLTKNVAVSRIKNYADWYYQEHLLPHFDLEEKHVFTILGEENELVKKALSDHRRLKRLFESHIDLEKNLSLIEDELESHIRFEERVLFNKIQEIASDEQLQSLKEIHKKGGFVDNIKDPFWSKKR